MGVYDVERFKAVVDQDEIHRKAQSGEVMERKVAASRLWEVFPNLINKEQAWNDLRRLISDKVSEVRAAALNSSGRVSIFTAGQAESDEHFRKELENALGFFEKASKEATYFNPSQFCLPFYRSFYTITFRKDDTEADVTKYLVEAKNAVQGSQSREKLLEAVENLTNALEEAQKAKGLDERKEYLNACRRYIDRACELLDSAEEKTPGAARVVRRGLPIIDEKIKGMLTEIQEKTKVLCRQTTGTIFDELGKDVYHIGQKLQVNNPVLLEKYIGDLQISISAICAITLDKKNTAKACELLKRANKEPIFENKIKMMDEVLSKIIPNLDDMKKIEIKDSENIQINTAGGAVQQMYVGIHEEKSKPKKSRFFEFINLSSIAATLSGFGTYIISETLDAIPVTDNKHLINAVLAIVVFVIILLVARKYTKR